MLMDGGLWPCFRQFPSRDTADAESRPPMIIVAMNGNDPFSPHPGLVLENETPFFEFGLRVLKRLTDRIVVAARKDCIDRLGPAGAHVTHQVESFYPSWDPGVVLYQLKSSVEENRSWTIPAAHLVLVARFLLSGKYPVRRVVTVSRPNDRKPHIVIRQGAPVRDIVGEIPQDSLITTGRFNGRVVDPDSHLGFFESTLTLIRPSAEDEMFGFVVPGFNKPSVSKTFASCLAEAPMELDCNLHGEERACINCGYCTDICPVDLMPSFIMKALQADDIEEALDLGMLDCCRCGLCSYTCPSKIELAHILSQGMDAHFKDTQSS